MNILIDINHPAHVHYFKNFYKIMTAKGHRILIISRKKEIAQKLLDLYEIPFLDRGEGKDGFFGKLGYMFYADLFIYRKAKEFNVDLFLNFLHPYPSQVAFFMGKKSFVFSDTEHAALHHRLTLPFLSKIFTPSCYRKNLGKKHIRFNSYMELSYLHPNYFTPDKTILKILGVNEEDKYVIVRFVSWGAAHDFGHSGMSLENKIKAIELMSNVAKVFITSEKELPNELEKFKIKIPFDKIHDAIYFSSLLFGESATMASEAAVLGTPSIFMDNDGRGYTDDQESKYGLVHNFTESQTDQIDAINKAIEILENPNSKIEFKKKREELLNNCLDTTSYIVDQVASLEF